MDSDLLTFGDELVLEAIKDRGEHDMARLEDKVCVVHDLMEKRQEQDREEIRNNFTEVFSRLRSVERQIWWFGGAVAALIFLGDFLPKLFKAIRP